MRTICFYSDYGYQDDFAGTCRAVIKRLAPEVEVIDVTHGIAPQNVLGGAFVLRNTMNYMPDGAVHLAVVDPGVGGRGERSPCAAAAVACSWGRTTASWCRPRKRTAV